MVNFLGFPVGKMYQIGRVLHRKRPMGIEPTSPAWKAGVMPLYDGRERAHGIQKAIVPSSLFRTCRRYRGTVHSTERKYHGNTR